MMKYEIEGEKNMPFELKKVTIISSQEGINKENADSNESAFFISYHRL